LLFIFHMLFVMTTPNFSKTKPSGFPFIFYLFDQSCIFFCGIVYDHCVWQLFWILQKFWTISYLKYLSYDFACVCVLCLAIKVCVLWFHVCCVSNLVIKFQIRSKYSTRFENEVFIHESVGGVGEIIGEVHMSLTCSMFNVENVQPKFDSNLSS
jgi:hypothetical protein